MPLTFTAEALKALIADAELKWPNGTRPVFGQEENPPKGFWIVGDHGVYLMHNGKHAEGADETKNVVAYAEECNPKTMDFEDWWATKQSTFGGDDGVDYIEPAFILECAAKGYDLKIAITPEEMSFAMGDA